MDAETSVLDRLLGGRCVCAIDAWSLLEGSSGRQERGWGSLASPPAPNGTSSRAAHSKNDHACDNCVDAEYALSTRGPTVKIRKC